MSNPSSDSSNSGLVYEDVLALRCKVIAGPLVGAELMRMHQSNEEVLRIVHSLDEYYPELTDEHGVGQELARMDFKLNLLLDLVSEVLAYYHDTPQRTPVKLSVDGIEWQSSQPPELHKLVLMEIYLNNKYPHPIFLPGRVEYVQALVTGSNIRVVFDSLDEIIQAWLEKIIFRHHRRQIASTRRHSPHGL